MEKAVEAQFVRILYFHLVTNAAKESLVAKAPGRMVCRKDDEDLEGNGKDVATEEHDVVDSRLHRHDPAVEQVLRSHALTAEVVYDEDAAVRLDLQRSGVELRLGRVTQVQVV